VVYEAAATPSIVVEQAENDFSDIYLDFEGDTLIVSRNSIRNRSGWFNNVSINTKNDRKVIKVNGKRVPYYVVRVSGPDLDGVLVKRSAKLTAIGVDSDNFDAAASSSGELELAGSARNGQPPSVVQRRYFRFRFPSGGSRPSIVIKRRHRSNSDRQRSGPD
jgi:hypothetical protein